MFLLKKALNLVMDSLETIAFVGSIYIVVILFLAMPTQVRGASMEPTIQNGDRLILNEMSVKLNDFKRGDIVAFHSPGNPDVEYIKRIIGLPSDKIEIKNGVVYVNGLFVNETYTSSPTILRDGAFLQEGMTVVVPERKLFVMGDNRENSYDSRAFGFVPIDSVVGKAIYRYFPPNRIGLLSTLF